MEKTIDWLLEDDTPQIKYRTLLELLGRGKDDSEVQKAYQNLLDSGELKAAMTKFTMKNKWEHLNALLILTEFGLTRKDVPIDDYVEALIKKLNANMKCARILLLRNLVALGFYDHPWVKEQIQTAFSAIREDGTIRCLDKTKKKNDSGLPDMGCCRQTTTYLLLAAELKKTGITLPQFEKLIDFYINHDVLYHTDGEDRLMIKEMAGTFFPIDHVHIGLQTILYGLSVLGAGNHDNCQKAWKLLQGYEDGEGRYILSDSFSEPYFDVGAVGKPNKWISFYALLSQKYSADIKALL